jgi:hypothetical protein
MIGTPAEMPKNKNNKPLNLLFLALLKLGDKLPRKTAKANIVIHKR